MEQKGKERTIFPLLVKLVFSIIHLSFPLPGWMMKSLKVALTFESVESHEVFCYTSQLKNKTNYKLVSSPRNTAFPQFSVCPTRSVLFPGIWQFSCNKKMPLSWEVWNDEWVNSEVVSRCSKSVFYSVHFCTKMTFNLVDDESGMPIFLLKLWHLTLYLYKNCKITFASYFITIL